MTHGFETEKIIAVTLYVVRKLESTGRNDFHTIFKVLYFADQKHLLKYGQPILEDDYVAMKNGPVPSFVYDGFKSLKSKHACNDFKAFEDSFKCSGMYVTALKHVDMDYISKSQRTCLEESFEENKGLSFDQLTDKSHDDAWHNANANDYINLLDIAKAGGANEEMIKYITTTRGNMTA